MKYRFLIEIADAPADPTLELDGVSTPNQTVAYQRLVTLGKQGRLGECVVQVQRVDEERDPIRAALKPKAK
jgi:hypothetical protein